MLFYSAAALIAALDQLVKYLVVQHLAPGQSLPLLGRAVRLTYVRNTGAAFSLFTGYSSYLALAGLIVAVAVIVWHTRTSPRDRRLQFALAAVLGGSLGNLLDRLLRSYVVDYLDLTVWPVFNLADVMINLGVLLLAWRLFHKEVNNVSGTV
ncbi:MAG: signal peptidase II [Candidatus Saganbacteria bacterium]|nr:signal peptidase II [Candidatus Saganbacteria bacterium]